MDWVPLFFIDDVCHQLLSDSLAAVSQLSGSWSEFGAEHGKTRRDLHFTYELENHEVNYSFRNAINWIFSEVIVKDKLNLEYDRIVSVTCNYGRSSDIRVSLNEFRRDVLPVIASLVGNCSWNYCKPGRSAMNLIVFDAFKNCPGFNVIEFPEQCQEMREFVARQVELANVKSLCLRNCKPITWTEIGKFAETLETFVRSARFHKLDAPGPLPNDFQLFEVFLERALAGELKRGARLSLQPTSFDLSRLGALHPEYRDDSMNIRTSRKSIEWRIPNSIRRIRYEPLTSTKQLYVY